MFECQVSRDGQDPAGFLSETVEHLARLGSQLWHVGKQGFADIAAKMDALAVQLDCARVALVEAGQTRGAADQSASPSSTDRLMEHSFHCEP